MLLVAVELSVLAFAEDPPPLAKVPFDADLAKCLQQQWTKHIDKPLVHTNSIDMKMVLIPPGEFTAARFIPKVTRTGSRVGSWTSAAEWSLTSDDARSVVCSTRRKER